MKALIIYFSGTGNTGMITDEIVSGLRREGWDAEAVSIERLDTGSRDFNFNLRTMDLLGFGFPVYKFTYPEIMESIFPFLSNLKPSRKPFFVYSTYCRFSAASLHRFASAIEAVEAADPGVHHIPVAMRSFKCPSNGIASLKEPGSRDYREVMYFSPGIGNLIDAFVNEISNGFELYHKNGEGIQHYGGLIDSFREKIVAGIERSRYPLLTIDRELCTVCGLCAKRCPDDNLVLSTEGEERQIIIRDTRGCLHCLRCLHVCPQNAVSFGPLVRGPSRYSPGIRKALYSDAAKKTVGAKEPGSRLSSFRWALGNLLAYLFRQ